MLEQLTGIPHLVAKRMFGAHGLYGDGVFFAIVDGGRLYFKAVGDSQDRYRSYGMGPFQASERQTLKTYYQVPVEILEDVDEILPWAKQAIADARCGAKPFKVKRPRKGF